MDNQLNLPVNQKELVKLINQNAFQKKPFFFMISFDQSKGYFLSDSKLFNKKILFSFPNFCNYQELKYFKTQSHTITAQPINYEFYMKQFNEVQQELMNGNSFLLNLTQEILINIKLSLPEIFHMSHAKYKIFMENQFVSFSPETFIKIDQSGKISTFPMKGTIDASIPDAANILLQDEKEIAEHYTIVDLMRNDLNQVAKQVKVEQFRYLELIHTHQSQIYQTSSKISGQLPENYLSHLGNIIFKLLPAGSISGAPKISTINIINRVETHNRGFYTGIAGFFDGQNLDTCVLIRFIQKKNQQLWYKSGGGITIYSQAAKEYQELIKKIYLPILLD